MVGLLAGIKLVMIEGRFDPPNALELIQDHKVTLWATVPTMVWRVCEYPDRHDYDTSSVVSVAFGGSPSAEELQRKVHETFPNVGTTTNAYGLTESSSVATAISGQDAIDKPDSVGQPVPTLELEDPRRQRATRCRPGQTGEVTMYGPLIMAGYWNKPEATADTVRDGWLYTGDIGYVDDDGFLFITDRAKDMIIRGGENIYCVEIENRLVEHPAIADAAVIGVPHPELGEEVKAVVQVEPGEAISRAGGTQLGGGGAGQLQGARLRGDPGRQAAAERFREAAEERAARRRRGQLRRDDVTRGRSDTSAAGHRSGRVRGLGARSGGVGPGTVHADIRRRLLLLPDRP